MKLFQRVQFYIIVILIILYLFFYTSSSISLIFKSITSPFIYFFYRTKNNVERFYLENQKKKLLIQKIIALEQYNEKLESLLSIYKNELGKANFIFKQNKYIQKSDSKFIGNFPLLSMYNLENKHFFIINGGIQDGIKKGDYIIYKNFLLGKIDKINYGTSIAIFIFDDDINVDGKIYNDSTTYSVGYCYKDNNKYLFRVFLKKMINIKKYIDNWVYTAGISKYFGKNIILGKVKKIDNISINRYDFELYFPYDFKNIELVSIFRKKGFK